MKKVCMLMLTSAFFITIFAFQIFAEYINDFPGSHSVYQNMNQGNFFMYYKWYNLDTFAPPIAGSTSSFNSGEIELVPNYFQEFDYIPNVDIKIIEPVHNINAYSIPNENLAVFEVKYCDKYENTPSGGYPLLIVTFPDNSTQTHTLTNTTDNIYQKTIDLPYGVYKYKYIATNDEYEKGLYEIEGEWYVTSRPRDFIKYAPVEFSEVLPDSVLFSWDVVSDEIGDTLKYEFYLGLDADKNLLQKIENGPLVNAMSYVLDRVEHKKQYYWYMKIINKYGADLETSLFSFITGGFVEKFYNAPNPFNPAKGQKTKFVFSMPEDGTAKIVVYSEYGDKVWESETLSALGNASSEVIFDGKDNSGKMLYNGTYLAILTKKYSGKTKTEKCRILVIK